VTTLWLTAGLFHQMVDSNLAGLAPVEQLLAGGDVLSPERVRAVLGAYPSCRLVNGYGPTENTTFTCCNPLRGSGEVGGSVAIGRPIANTRVHLMDRTLRAAPMGVPAELLAGGDGLARGYQARPALTAERFIPDPLGGPGGGRLYRSGDLARWLPDGRLDFLGRLDRQVKIRGFRVEPGEVERVLSQHPAIRKAAVVVSNSGEERFLAAYLVWQAEAAGEVGELRAWLREKVPAHLLPEVFIPLPELPLTASGKVDRATLPAPGAPQADEQAYVPPRSPLEEQLAEIWRRVLGSDRIGVHDNFFEIGGHSLKATRIIAHLRQELGVELPLEALFEEPTIAGLAAAVVQAMAERMESGALDELLAEAESLDLAPVGEARPAGWS
jgi:acyl-coenzyme A synthetase/AMP-(fatty) acid ligase/acyl carrier protein